jgi:membrane protease YdiL (CAAX protease family)
MKKGSIYSRSDGFSIISSITDLVIPVNSGKLTESGYINLISIAGILIYPYFIFNFYIMIILIRKVRNELRRDRKLFYVGVLMFFVSYSIAMLNIPVSIVYPLNALYFYFLGILYCGSTNQNKLYELQN